MAENEILKDLLADKQRMLRETAAKDELSKNIGIEKNNVGWRSSEMQDDGIIHSADRNKYAISPAKALDILDGIRKKFGL